MGGLTLWVASGDMLFQEIFFYVYALRSILVHSETNMTKNGPILIEQTRQLELPKYFRHVDQVFATRGLVTFRVA